MKVIDLLNKIANEEKIPGKIKFNDYEYLYHDKEYGYCRYNYNCTYICLNSEYYLFDILNDEVEILEEEKKIPEKLILHTLSNNDSADFTTLQDFNNRDIQRTVNLILDYLKSKGE